MLNLLNKLGCSYLEHKKKHRHAKRAGVIFCDRNMRRTGLFGCNVQQERNWEFIMYIRYYIGNGKIATW